MSDGNFFTSAATSPFLPIVAGLIRGIVGMASAAGSVWALGVTGDQITMYSLLAVASGMLGWSVWQKVAAWRASRQAQVSAAVASAEATVTAGRATPVTVTVTPVGHPNVATLVSREEQYAAAPVPGGVAPSPAPAV